ncbi:erythroblast NAD(P)(+)--arginine ADP-ribosyltransferase-like [Corapipo altera]|uniref:erythroblast NAD(P)(+)--arginine ADP-ribosyltransferase-like n=1 Tax=Corapipo altera TaxID=415028 RepID=UPI000FD62A89|nr:erythroblast NAD(P)(+)--arginine ADP-ribosyltransferase-like [Corapipo altera]XP_027487636.1 erythroblast NAD(P)(+)--arginine ADP-ribosyltransferase-like [Corapipo altera]XP_027487637.1 erythroblast NAD(P)(+)--arginine ADP-ribosyltransferase-like [Corapipo altera]XP_027487638.1 erythroblast NAD(P)(+)--arginine ADP-ribosyltransferase-like [Corapipo altera]XP_027487639.1 erythroblast NAD(P)(+)--arginine ADP-ribosyltransferase-like [Corapipo altera]
MELLMLVLLATTLASSVPPRWPGLNSTLREIELSMAPHSFDDQYLRCRIKMTKALRALNRTEFATNSDYADAWGKATIKWHSRKFVGSQLPREQAIALMAYSMEEGLYLEFNKAVRSAGRSHQEYLHNFPFKVVHFLLTEALDNLRDEESHPRCLDVYRGIEGIRFLTEPGRTIRFGQFASSSLLKNVSEHYGTDTFFEVHTCHGANIRNFSNYPNEEEVLIPPFETFNVTSVTRQGEKTNIQLRSHGVYSKYNCAWLRGSSIRREPPHLRGLLLAMLALAVAIGTP